MIRSPDSESAWLIDRPGGPGARPDEDVGLQIGWKQIPTTRHRKMTNGDIRERPVVDIVCQPTG